MSVGNSEMLEQFAIETQQHLDEIEPILMQAQSDSLDKTGIAALFRGFHSLKGLSRLFDLHGMEALAHHAESLLSEVRSERLSMSQEIMETLLAALDCIRTQREQAIIDGSDSPAPQDLLAALDGATKGKAGQASSVAAKPQSVPASLHDDHDTLIYFAEMLTECLPNLAVLLGGAGDAEQAADDLDALMTAAERLQLHGLQAHLAELASLDSSKPVIDRLAAVIVDARRFGRLMSHEAGADETVAAVASPLRRAMAETAKALAASLASEPETALAAAERLAALAATGLEDGGISSLVLQSLGNGAAVEPALAALQQLIADLASDGVDGIDLLRMAAEQLRDVMRGGWSLDAPLRKLLEDRGVDPRRLAGINVAAMERLATLLEGGQRKLVFVAVSLPARGDKTEFLRWLDQRLQPVSINPLPLAGSDGVALLAVSTDSPALIRSQILEADPEILFVEARQLSGQAFDHPWKPARAAKAEGAGGGGDNQVRVPVEILDRLFGRIGEFFSISSALNVVMVDSQVPVVLQKISDHVAQEAPALIPAIELLQRQQHDLSQIEVEVHRLVSLIHEATLGLRVIPLDIVFNRFPRMIRELAKEQGKQIRFEARADGIKVDKGMTELLADPLMHMLRNAVDHAIEMPDERVAAGKPRAANIRLTALQNGNRITVEIADDGRGIDTERVRQKAVSQGLVTESDSRNLSKDQIHRFIFSPGFSTAEQVTDTSGRGVGMDVALINVSRLGGRIDIHTIPGQGTTFRLDMPLSAAMQTVLLAETSVQTVAFPERMVVEAATVSRDAIQYVNGQRAILMHDRFLPLFRVAELLCLPDQPDDPTEQDLSVIVVASNRFRYGVEVGRILRRHEMLIRETHPRIAQLPGIGGVSTLGTDRIVLVVDPEGLTDLACRAVVPGMRAASRAAE
jgi:chemotaxis protein histidine kinase CheA